MKYQKGDIWNCRACGYAWYSRVEKPKACPRCKVYLKEGGKNYGQPIEDRKKLSATRGAKAKV